MESAFKIIFGIAVFIFCIIVIAVFLLIVKFIFMFTPEISIMGVTLSPAGASPY